MLHTSKQDKWVDESGDAIPFTRITALERKTESSCTKVFKDAKRINTLLQEFKETVQSLMTDIYERSLEKAGVDAKKGKGNFTVFSFDRSIKIICAIQDRIDFDSIQIEAAQVKLNEYLNDQLGGVDPFVRELINSAFETSHGKLDTKKVFNLLKHGKRIKAAKFQEAMELINQSIRKPDNKQYYRVFERDNNGEYQLINLNFSAV